MSLPAYYGYRLKSVDYHWLSARSAVLVIMITADPGLNGYKILCPKEKKHG